MSKAERWIRIAPCESIPPREGRAALVDGREIAIFNLGDRFLAVDNRCPHQSGPLCDGIVAGETVHVRIRSTDRQTVDRTSLRVSSPTLAFECDRP